MCSVGPMLRGEGQALEARFAAVMLHHPWGPLPPELPRQLMVAPAHISHRTTEAALEGPGYDMSALHLPARPQCPSCTPCVDVPPF